MSTGKKINALASLFARRAEIEEKILSIIGDVDEEETEDEEDDAEDEYKSIKNHHTEEGKFKKCSIDDCENRHLARGFCSKHYYQNSKSKNAGVCRVTGCSQSSTARGLCESHHKTKENQQNTIAVHMVKMYCNDCEHQFEHSIPTIDAVCPACNSIEVFKSKYQG